MRVILFEQLFPCLCSNNNDKKKKCIVYNGPPTCENSIINFTLILIRNIQHKICSEKLVTHNKPPIVLSVAFN